MVRLSELQLKEIVDIRDGRRIGMIVDVIVDDTGKIIKLIIEEKRGRRFSKEESEVMWQKIIKIGDDIILIDTRNGEHRPGN